MGGEQLERQGQGVGAEKKPGKYGRAERERAGLREDGREGHSHTQPESLQALRERQ